MLRMLAIASMALGVVATAHAAQPIATTEGEMSGTSLEVHQLKVSNGVTLLTFTVKNNSDDYFHPNSMDDTTVKSPDDNSINGVYLIE
jgi:hypothetical protein